LVVEQAYQSAIATAPPTWDAYDDGMLSFYLALGLAFKRAARFEEARAAYDRADEFVAKFPSGQRRDEAREVLSGNMRILESDTQLAKVVARSRGAKELYLPGVAEETLAQLNDENFTWFDAAMAETRKAVQAVRATRASAQAVQAEGQAAGAGPGAGKARRRREKRLRRKQRSQAQATSHSQGSVAGVDADANPGAGADDAGAVDPAPGAQPAGEPIPGEAEEESPECAICCEGLELGGDEEEEPVPLECGHSYHRLCIDQWVATCANKGFPKTCPYCRVELAL
jgi:hypothetical protein